MSRYAPMGVPSQHSIIAIIRQPYVFGVPTILEAVEP